MTILLVGGSWTQTKGKNGLFGKRSVIVDKVYEALELESEHVNPFGHNDFHIVSVFNGGEYKHLRDLLNICNHYDVVFWWPNVDDSLPKIRNVKEVAPHTMLVSSKRNDGDQYDFVQLSQSALTLKSTLSFEFKPKKKEIDGEMKLVYHIRVLDPLGCLWYEGDDTVEAVKAAMNRLEYLKSISHHKDNENNSRSLVLDWYFEQFKQKEHQSSAKVKIPGEYEFVKIVRDYSEQFIKIANPSRDVRRSISMAYSHPIAPQVGRYAKGMPSFRDGEYVFVSKRNIDKQYIDLNDFVPCYLEKGELYYCGNNLPATDSVVQLRLYKQFPNIKYILHSHCYIDGAPFTNKSVPCGAIEGVEEILHAISENYGSKNKTFYVLNLKGHGSLLMAGSLEKLKDIKYVGREMPEIMF